MVEPRDLIGYGPNPPQFEWPDGSRLAVSVVVSIEEGAERNPMDGDPVIEPLAEWGFPMPPGERDLTVESEYEYGSRVGVWRVLELFDQYAIRPTVFGCALALERNPHIADAIRDRDYDVVAHGYRWVSHQGLTDQQERDSVRQTLTSLAETTGVDVIGWHNRSPLPPTTRAVLAKEGLLFDCHSLSDDLPYFADVDGRPFLVVPYAPDTNDIRFWRSGLFLASEFAMYCTDTLEGFVKQSLRIPRLMSVGVHPRIIGRPGRLSGLEAFLERLASTPGVWIAGRTDIARFWASKFAPEGTWNWPREGESASLPA